MLSGVKELLEPPDGDDLMEVITKCRRTFKTLVYSECKHKLRDLKEEMQKYEAGPLRFHQEALDGAEEDLARRHAIEEYSQKMTAIPADSEGIARGAPVNNRVFGAELSEFTIKNLDFAIHEAGKKVVNRLMGKFVKEQASKEAQTIPYTEITLVY